MLCEGRADVACVGSTQPHERVCVTSLRACRAHGRRCVCMQTRWATEQRVRVRVRHYGAGVRSQATADHAPKGPLIRYTIATLPRATSFAKVPQVGGSGCLAQCTRSRALVWFVWPVLWVQLLVVIQSLRRADTGAFVLFKVRLSRHVVFEVMVTCCAGPTRTRLVPSKAAFIIGC